jgi:hypothetical protein
VLFCRKNNVPILGTPSSLFYLAILDRCDQFPKLVKFSEPYASKSFYGFKYLNLNSKIIKYFIQVCLSAIKAKEEKLISKEITGKLFDMIDEVKFIKSYYSDDNEIKIDEFNFQINEIIDEAIKNRIIENGFSIKSEIVFDDFIENTITIDKKNKSFKANFEFKKYLKGKNEWGNKIS